MIKALGDTDNRAGVIDLWQVECRNLPPGVLARCNRVLNAAEQAQAARYRRDVDALRFRLGRGLSRLVCARHTGIAPKALVWGQQDRGKPFWRNSECPFNLSHSGEYLWLAVGGPDALGVDIQREDPGLDVEAIADFSLSGSEKSHLAGLCDGQRRSRFFALWVLREAAFKATGQGVFEALHRVSALPLPVGGRWARAAGLGDARLWTRIVPAPPGYAGALASLSGPMAPPEIRLRSLTDL